MNTIQDQWADFKSKVVPKTASSTQISEMKKSFYAGAYAAVMVMVKIGSDDFSEETGAEIFETLKNECEAFGATGGI